MVSGQQHAPAALYPPGENPGTYFTGGWVGPRAGLDGRGKSPVPTVIRSRGRPPRSSVVIPSELTEPLREQRNRKAGAMYIITTLL
jgi:hypothetical protein